jgi:hypothetical protein
VKQYLLGNLGTMIMALVLSLVTWTYLFTQGIGPEEIIVEFAPAPLDPEVFASVQYRDAAGETLVPGGTFPVQIVGPKGDVRSIALRPPRTFRCELAVDPKDLSLDRGSLKLTLDRKNFTIQGNDIQVRPQLPQAGQITVHYVKFVERTVELAATRFDVDGRPLRGFRVDSVTPSIPRLKCRVPADRADELRQVRIRPVPVEGKQETFTTLEWYLEDGARQRAIKPIETFRIEVRIVPDVVSKRITADLGLSGRPEVLRRVQLETKSIVLEIQGPEDLVKEAPDSAFSPFVVVTERDVQTPGLQNLAELGTYILDPKYRGFTVVPMADVPPANRTVKVNVLPKTP